MTRNKIQAMLHHICEMQKLLFEAQKCGQETCNFCDYKKICNEITILNTIIVREAYRYNMRGELKDDINQHK